MAKRESQGLQIALILFVMITVVLAVTTFVFFRKAEENVAKAKAADDAKKTAEALVDQQSFWNSYFKHIVGSKTLSEAELNVVIPSVEGDEEMAAVHAAYQQDMGTYGEGLTQEKLNYRELPGIILQQIRKLNTANTDLLESNNRLIAERDQIKADSLKEIALARQGEQKATDALATERDTFNADRAAITAKQEAEFANYTKVIGEKTALVAVREKTISERDTAIKDLDGTVAKQKETITELRDEPFEAPDGRIAWVNQASRTVWVNLGMADGLRRQTTFSVYDHDAMNVAPSSGGALETMRRLLSGWSTNARG